MEEVPEQLEEREERGDTPSTIRREGYCPFCFVLGGGNLSLPPSPQSMSNPDFKFKDLAPVNQQEQPFEVGTAKAGSRARAYRGKWG